MLAALAYIALLAAAVVGVTMAVLLMIGVWK